MTFWAQRAETNGAEAHQLAPAADNWIEAAVRRMLVSIMPQFQPILTQAEAVLSNAQTTLGELREEQRAIRAEIVAIRERLETAKLSDDA